MVHYVFTDTILSINLVKQKLTFHVMMMSVASML